MLGKALERSMRSWVYWRHFPAEFHCALILVSPAAGLKYLHTPMEKIALPSPRNVREFVSPWRCRLGRRRRCRLIHICRGIHGRPARAVAALEPDTSLTSLLERSRRASTPGMRLSRLCLLP
jgi:hypothetical protein